MTTQDNKTTRKTRFNDVASGIQKNVTTDMTLGGVTYTPPALAAVFTSASAAIAKADADYKAWRDSVAKMRTSVAQAKEVYKLLRNHLVSQYGTAEHSPLGDFGMTAPKPTTTKTASTKAAAAVKAAATRVLRHTMGPKQKKQVKSTIHVETVPVPAVDIVAPTTPAAAATTPTAAPATNGGATTAKSGS
jgi:hypothetical protein